MAGLSGQILDYFWINVEARTVEYMVSPCVFQSVYMAEIVSMRSSVGALFLKCLLRSDSRDDFHKSEWLPAVPRRGQPGLQVFSNQGRVARYQMATQFFSDTTLPTLPSADLLVD